MRRTLILLVMILLLVLPLGAMADDDPINLVATTGMIADAAANVGGERVDVVQLMGEGVDPHLYVATASDTLLFADADIILYNGLDLEANLTNVFEQIGRRGVTVVAVAEALPEDVLLEEEDMEVSDPHVWMDVSRWMLVVDAVAEALSEYDPANADEYAANAESYKEMLEILHEEVTAAIASIPEDQRILVTAHDAFQYFGDAYGIEVFAPQAMTTEAEAGVDDIRQTVEILVSREVPAMFVETSVSPDVVLAVIEAAAARGWDVALAERELYSDAMGTPGTFEGTYIGMITANTNTIVEALGGDVFVSVPDDENGSDEGNDE